MSAEQNEPNGLFHCGRFYEFGVENVVQIDLQKAKDFYIKADQEGYQDAKPVLQRIDQKLKNNH